MIPSIYLSFVGMACLGAARNPEYRPTYRLMMGFLAGLFFFIVAMYLVAMAQGVSK